MAGDRIVLRIVVLSAVLLLGATYLARAQRAEPIAVRESLAQFPMEFSGWEGRRAQDFDSRVLTILGVDEYLNRVYWRKDEPPIGAYIGYYQSQRQGDTIHSPLNCLPGAGWEPVSKDALTIEVPVTSDSASPVRSIAVNRYVIQKGADRQMVLYWYQSHGRVVASEYWSKIYMVLDAVRTTRTDASLVRVITPIVETTSGAESDAEQRAVGFVKAMFPLLGQYLPS